MYHFTDYALPPDHFPFLVFRNRTQMDIVASWASTPTNILFLNTTQKNKILHFYSAQANLQTNKKRKKNMISLNSIHTSLSLPHRRKTSLFKGKKRRLNCTCCSREEERMDSASPVGGDRRMQEILATIAMLQAQKVRVVNYLDDQAKNLNKFGENANAELEEIGKSMLSDLDETSDRVSTFAQFSFLPFCLANYGW
jgi:hypothetical protein